MTSPSPWQTLHDDDEPPTLGWVGATDDEALASLVGAPEPEPEDDPRHYQPDE